MGMTPEGKIQAYAVRQAKKAGFLARRLQYIGRNGATDLLLVCGYDVTGFCEVKKDEHTDPDPLQLAEHRHLREHGANVFVVGTRAEVDRMIKRLRFLVAVAKQNATRGILR